MRVVGRRGGVAVNIGHRSFPLPRGDSGDLRVERGEWREGQELGIFISNWDHQLVNGIASHC